MPKRDFSRSKKQDLKNLADQVEKEIKAPFKSDKIEVRFDRNVVSTGSTLLDLAISGNRIRGGGIPGGVIVEIFGPSGYGKTALLSEILASTQIRGGDIKVGDPEGRLDREYAKIYGVNISNHHYDRPDTVPQMFESIWAWKPKPKFSESVCTYGGDSLAALSTDLEMSEKGDKMGMRRAKEFSEWMRKTCRVIANNNWLVVLTNQVRVGDMGSETTPGGKAIEFYSTLRLRVGPAKGGWQIIEKSKINEMEFEKVTGIRCGVSVKKSTVDDPYRTTFVSIRFGYGIDDVRENLQFLKDNDVQIVKKKTGEEEIKPYSWYPCIDRQVQSLNEAVIYVEENEYQDQVREKVIDLWEKIQNSFETGRKPKTRR